MSDPLWDYRQDEWSGRDLIGFKVMAKDGHIGKVDAATDMVDMSCLVVDTGPWIFGKRVVIPVGLVDEIDDSLHSVTVDRTKEEIKEAPPYDDELFYDESYRDELGAYYTPREAVNVAPWERGGTA
jgi:ribosomal 30S subunit maturation factor RimM